MAEENKNLIRCRAILEILGKPKEHVEKTMNILLEKIKEDPDNSVLSEKFAEIKPTGKTMFSTFIELEMLFKGLGSLAGFCFDFMPSSIEIEKPEQLVLKNKAVSDLFNDLQAKLHDVDRAAKTIRAQRDLLQRNFSKVIGNLIAVLIKVGKSEIDDLSKFTGIEKGELQGYIDHLIKEGKIKKEGDGYQLAVSGDK
ncbi:hypothetical protein KY358_03015 [Candidatus Woesearchaeota archaeon]|nr:hypothetical protein [Candidatus Woesearchaeota archaeon]